MTRVGTSHFISYTAAIRYYKPYGYSPKDVRAKFNAGEIHLGRPVPKAGLSVGIIPGEGRYYYLEEASTIVPMGKP